MMAADTLPSIASALLAGAVTAAQAAAAAQG